MTIYETIKAAISVKQAAEHYGLKVNRNGMACCPFHNDRHPSLKLNEDYFFCFGCGAKGDVIDFVARLFDLNGYEATQKLAADFGISAEPGQAAAASCKPKRPHIRQFREDEMLCFRVLTDYLHLLEDWNVRYAPKTPDDLRAPAETQQSDFGGKRTSSEMSELSPQGGSEGYGACEDVDDRFVEALVRFLKTALPVPIWNTSCCAWMMILKGNVTHFFQQELKISCRSVDNTVL